MDEAWALLSDFSRSPSPAFPVVVYEEGEAGYNGVGAIRSLAVGKVEVMERLEAVEPYRSFMYCILSGSPVVQYLGKFEFEDAHGATAIRWSCDFKPIVPLSGWLIALVTKRVVHRILSQMEEDYRP